MPKVKVNGITINYESQGSGEPLVLIPYLAADNACYAFQVADYAKHFTCISLDPRGGAGESGQAGGDLFDPIVRGRRRLLHGCDRGRESSCERGVARGRHRSVARSQISRARQDAFHSLLLAEERSIPQGRGAKLADHCQGSRQRPGNDHRGDLSLLFHARALRGQARGTSISSPPSCAAARNSRSTPSCVNRTRSSPTTRSASSARSRRRCKSPSTSMTW